MQDSQIEEIKNKLDVVDVVGSYVKLTRTGINHRGVCPFHSEKKPSFFVSPARQMWKCFGCGKGGDIFAFVKEIEGVEFGDALRILASRAGVQLKRENPQLRTERQRLYEICELACSFFQKQLDASTVGKEAKEYLQKRGIKNESITKWRIGYSPDTWRGLSDFLVGKGYLRQEIVKAGLAVEKGRSDCYDRFRGRIVFPIFDGNSQVIGFGARIFKNSQSKEMAKYINTPQTMLYDKSNVLYGINNAKVAVRKSNQCVITEGYTDAIMCHQAGFENTVAASGTALTPQHLNILKRYTDNLLLAFDMDVAGDSATKRGINLAEAQGFNIKVIDTYSRGEDPADIILKNPADWEKCLNSTRGIMDFYFDSAFSGFDKKTPQGKKEIGKMVLPAIKRLPNKIEQAHWAQKLAENLEVPVDVINEELNATKITDVSARMPEKPEAKQKIDGPKDAESRKRLIEEKIISLIMRDPQSIALIEDRHTNLFSQKTKEVLQTLKNASADKAVFADIFSKVSAENTDFKNFLDTLSFRAEVDFENDGPDEIMLCLNQLSGMNTRERLNSISLEIKKAEQNGDFEKVNLLMDEFNSLAKELPS